MIVDKYSGCFLYLPEQKIRKAVICSNKQRLEKGLLPLLFKITSSSGHGNWLTCLSKKQRTDTSGQIHHSFSQISGIHAADIVWEIEKQTESALNRTKLRQKPRNFLSSPCVKAQSCKEESFPSKLALDRYPH